MSILYELSWLWEVLGIGFAAAVVCVVCTMLIGKAAKKNLSKKNMVIIGVVAFVLAVFIVFEIARTPMPL